MNKQIVSKKLYNLLSQFKKNTFLLIELSGNYGDDLIYMGARKIFDSLGIRYKSIYYADFLTQSGEFQNNYVFYIHGGFSFNKLWNSGTVQTFQTIVSNNLGNLIIGPQTYIEEEKGFISENLSKFYNDTKYSKKMHIFTRDMRSYKFLKTILPSSINLDHDHDTALNLTKDDFVNLSKSSVRTFYAIRIDKEKLDLTKSNPFKLWFDPIDYCKNFESWVNVHSKARKIVTNRLHSSILGSILGKEVVLLPNKYHKNRSVWEYSLSEKIKWQDALTLSVIEKQLMKIGIYNRICASYKLHAIQQYFYMGQL